MKTYQLVIVLLGAAIVLTVNVISIAVWLMHSG